MAARGAHVNLVGFSEFALLRRSEPELRFHAVFSLKMHSTVQIETTAAYSAASHAVFRARERTARRTSLDFATGGHVLRLACSWSRQELIRLPDALIHIQVRLAFVCVFEFDRLSLLFVLAPGQFRAYCQVMVTGSYYATCSCLSRCPRSGTMLIN